MRIAYCDDEKLQGIFIKELVLEWEKSSNIPCDITVYGSAEEMLFENPDSFPFDFIILDIELNQMNGLELARRIRILDKNVPITFLSNSREYVFEGYEVQAIRYLVKPITAKQLFPILDLVVQEASQLKPYIIIGNAGEKRRLELENILYIEALGHYVGIHTQKDVYEFKMNLNDINKRLDHSFVTTHRSYLVNLKHIEKITKTECLMKGGHSVPVSRSAYKLVNQEFITYHKGGILDD